MWQNWLAVYGYVKEKQSDLLREAESMRKANELRRRSRHQRTRLPGQPLCDTCPLRDPAHEADRSPARAWS